MSVAPASPDVDAHRSWLHRVGGALTHRNFRIVWLAALGSTIGTWMQSFAQSWLIFDLTKSNFYLGLDAFLSQLPVLLFMVIGGVIADRHDRRRLLTGSQYVQMFSAVSLAILVLVYGNQLGIWAIFALSFISGCGQAFGGPAYQSMLPSLVPRRDLPNAIALNSTQFNLSRVLGPAAGGIVLATIGTAACFLLNGLSFFFVVIALTMLHLPPHAPPAPRALSDELRTGLHYVRDTRLMLTLTVLVFISTFLSMPILTLLPAFANNVLTSSHAPETRLSMLMACQGLGAIVGALTIGSLGRFAHMGRALLVIQVVLGLLIAAFAYSRQLPLSLGLLFVCGMFSMALFSISFSLVQLTVPDALRGRVVSIYMVALRGGWPIGALVAGALADTFSAPAVMTGNGVVLALLAGTLLMVRRRTALGEV